MKKTDEINNPVSCWNRASVVENIFVLLGRDIATPDTIRHWVGIRIARDKNRVDDPQILEALKLADEIEADLRAAGKYVVPGGGDVELIGELDQGIGSNGAFG